MKKQFFSLLLVLCMVLALMPFGAMAADSPKDPSLPLNTDLTYNVSTQSYGSHLTFYEDGVKITTNYNYGNIVTSNLIPNADGTLTRVEALNEQTVLIEDYNSNFEMVWKHKIPMELKGYVGFYAGKDYNFIAYADANQDEDDQVEVLRFVRYTKNWHRVDAVGVFGANTTIPCDAGSLRMVQIDDMLYVFTCHEMYADKNGVNHQASVYLSIHIPDMKLVEQETGVSESFLYVSHCFNQYLLNDNGKLVLLAQGDMFPRAFVLTVINDGYEPGTKMEDCRKILEFGYSEEFHYHYNYTGASAGGLEASSTHYLIAGTMIDQEKLHIETDPGNVVIHAVEKSQFDRTYFDGITKYASVNSEIIPLTHYADGDPVEIETPHIVKVGSDHFLVLWVEHHDRDSELHYVFTDGTGHPIGEPTVRPGALSDCRPVLSSNRVVWYTTNVSAPEFDTVTVPAEYLNDQTKPSPSAEQTVTPAPKPTDSNPFKDVKSDAYYYQPVLWAVKHNPQITAGTSATTFSPETACTRAQMVTFLWRAKGQPEPTIKQNPFTDVKASDYFYRAVLWAVENKITAGTSATTFSPNATVTRAQTVTFLWRMEGSPSASAANPFKDVAMDQYYAKAVLWAVENEITSGTSAKKFSPSNPCTRGQIVTFLYRDLT